MKRPKWHKFFAHGRLAAGCSLFDMLTEVLDLRTGGNLNDPAERAECWATLDERNPMVVIGSLLQLSESAVKRLKPGDLQRLETEGPAHLTFCESLHRWQSEKKRRFLHEHPWHVSSWSSTPMKALCAWADTAATRCGRCMFGDVTWHRAGNRWEKRPSQRRTGWVTNFQELSDTLATTCEGEDGHAHGTAGRGLTATERYSPEFVAAILKAIRRYERRRQGI